MTRGRLPDWYVRAWREISVEQSALDFQLNPLTIPCRTAPQLRRSHASSIEDMDRTRSPYIQYEYDMTTTTRVHLYDKIAEYGVQDFLIGPLMSSGFGVWHISMFSFLIAIPAYFLVI